MNYFSQRCLAKALLTVLIWVTATPVLSQTYSPYTPEQLKEINGQPLGLEETPMGAIYPGERPPTGQPKPSLGPNYSSQPLGEEEAEAQESGSAAAFDPRFSLFQF